MPTPYAIVVTEVSFVNTLAFYAHYWSGNEDGSDSPYLNSKANSYTYNICLSSHKSELLSTL